MKSRDPWSAAWPRRAGAALLGALLLLGGVDILRAGSGTGDVLGRFSSGWAAAIAIYSLLAALAGILCLRALLSPPEVTERIFGRMENGASTLRGGRWPLIVVLIALPSILLLGPWAILLTGPWLRWDILVLCSIGAGLLLPRSGISRLGRLLLAILITASVFVLAKHLVLVTDYPFKLGWSEGNRLWDYSLYFGRERYLLEEAFRYPTSLTPGRHGLWGLPFLIPGVSIAVVRLWDAVLWTLPYLILGWAVFRPLGKNAPTAARAGLALWAFLFLTQGPIYAPLVLSALLLTLGYDSERPWRTALVTLLASFYAGMSRWTWMVAPAIWSGMRALLDTPQAAPLLRRFSRPVFFGLSGLIGAGASYVFMAAAFPQPDPIYATALSQPLLWYRLLPNPTNPIGVIPGLILAVGPFFGLGAWALSRRMHRLDGWQALGLGVALAGFLAAGLVASVKIGGGSNLHNLDMFLVTLVLLAGVGLRKILDRGRLTLDGVDNTGRALIALTVLVVSWAAARQGGPLSLPPDPVVERALGMVRAEVARASSEGEVLFLDQRQLLTFGEVAGVPLVMEYELKDVVNQALAGNVAFFDRFYEDLARGRFALIVSPPIETELRGRSHPFGEEDDAQVIYLYRPLLEHYEPVVILNEVSVWLLRPRQPMQAPQFASGSAAGAGSAAP